VAGVIKPSVLKLMERRADLIRCLVPKIRFEVSSINGRGLIRGTLGTHDFYQGFSANCFDLSRPQAERVLVERIMDCVFGDHAYGTSIIRDAELAP
jgi:hypothetical protein